MIDISRLGNGASLLGCHADFVVAGVLIAVECNGQRGAAHTGHNINWIFAGILKPQIQAAIADSGILPDGAVGRRPGMVIPGQNFQVGTNGCAIDRGGGLTDTAAVFVY